MQGRLSEAKPRRAFIDMRNVGSPLRGLAHPTLADNEQLNSELKEYVGKPVKAFFDNVLTAKFRNAIAHFVTDDGSVLQVSAPAEIYIYSGLALITDLCARQLIASHELLLAQLPHP